MYCLAGTERAFWLDLPGRRCLYHGCFGWRPLASAMPSQPERPSFSFHMHLASSAAATVANVVESEDRQGAETRGLLPTMATTPMGSGSKAG